uniref:Transmembrane protein 182-like n=1 Tax=Poecilia latipinna TaxID=48699 RepID=A0A3B3VJI1_9TELE
MKIGAAALAGGTFGVVGTLCFLVAFSTDYWLVAVADSAAVAPSWLTLHHEGFFRRCMYPVEPTTPALLASFISMFVFPAVFRGLWTVLIVVGLLSALTGGLLLVCGVPFISSKLYRLGGAFLIAAAVLLLLLLLFFVLWMEAVDVSSYVLQKVREDCPDAAVSVHYGLSFMAAAAGVPLEVLSGLLFLLVGRTLSAGR